MKTNKLILLVRQNWKSGLTVAFISLPLSIALSIASGAGPVPGIITGIWAPLVAAIFGSSNYNVIGVAGALTTLIFAASVTQFNGETSVWLLPIIAITVGVVIMLIYALRLERFLRYIPSAVLYGFATGVAVLIAANQLFDALGLSLLKHTGHFIGDVEVLFANIGKTHLPSLLVFGAFLLTLLLWKKYIKALPGVIPISIAGALLGYVTSKFPSLDIGLITLVDKFGSVRAQLFDLPEFGRAFHFVTEPSQATWLLSSAFIIAIVAVLETLMTARIGDKITKTEHSPRVELRGLGLSNIAAGLTGGLPSTGVFIRTGINIKSGATHRMSQGLAALFTVALAFIFMPLLQYLPLPVIAAILFMTAIGLIEFDRFAHFWKSEKTSLVIGLVVAGTTVVHDAGLGVAIGTVLALLLFIDRVTRGSYDIQFNANGKRIAMPKGEAFRIPIALKPDLVVYSISGFLSYIDVPLHTNRLRLIANVKSMEHVILRLRNLNTIDLDAADELAEIVTEIQHAGKTVHITSANDAIAGVLLRYPVFTSLKNNDHWYEKTKDALAGIGYSAEQMKRNAPVKIYTPELES